MSANPQDDDFFMVDREITSACGKSSACGTAICSPAPEMLEQAQGALQDHPADAVDAMDCIPDDLLLDVDAAPLSFEAVEMQCSQFSPREWHLEQKIADLEARLVEANRSYDRLNWYTTWYTTEVEIQRDNVFARAKHELEDMAAKHTKCHDLIIRERMASEENIQLGWQLYHEIEMIKAQEGLQQHHDKEMASAREGLQQQQQKEMAEAQEGFELEAQSLLNELDKAHQQKVEAETEAEELRKKWQNAASQLKKLTASTRPPQQASDRDLIDMTESLRYEVRNFSTTMLAARRAASQGRQPIHPAQPQAFLWKYLMREVFGCFVWAGSAKTLLQDLVQLCVSSAYEPTSPSMTPSQLKRIQNWSYDTVSIAMESQRDSKKLERLSGDRRSQAVDAMCQRTKWLNAKDDNDYRKALGTIYDKAVALDKAIYKRTAHFKWHMVDAKVRPRFERDYMVLESGQEPKDPQPRITLVVSPALLKARPSCQGEATGDQILLPMEVLCMSPSPQRRVMESPAVFAWGVRKLIFGSGKWSKG